MSMNAGVFSCASTAVVKISAVSLPVCLHFICLPACKLFACSNCRLPCCSATLASSPLSTFDSAFFRSLFLGPWWSYDHDFSYKLLNYLVGLVCQIWFKSVHGKYVIIDVSHVMDAHTYGWMDGRQQSKGEALSLFWRESLAKILILSKPI